MCVCIYIYMENFQLTISKFFNIYFGIQQFNLKLANNSKNNWLTIKCCTNVQCLPIFSYILTNIDSFVVSLQSTARSLCSQSNS